jgi:hypothetical protein
MTLYFSSIPPTIPAIPDFPLARIPRFAMMEALYLQ